MRVWKYALSIGLLISLFLALLSTTGNYGLSPIKYAKFLILIAGLIMFYRRSKNNLSESPNLFKYIASGAKISFVAAAMVGLTNMLLFFFDPSFAIQKYNLEANTIGGAAAISAFLFVELLVMGLLCSYVVYPLFKQKLLVPQPEDNEGSSKAQNNN